MNHTILERTANSLSENLHNIGEDPQVVDGDADLLENDPVMCLGGVFYMFARNMAGVTARRFADPVPDVLSGIVEFRCNRNNEGSFSAILNPCMRLFAVSSRIPSSVQTFPWQIVVRKFFSINCLPASSAAACNEARMLPSRARLLLIHVSLSTTCGPTGSPFPSNSTASKTRVPRPRSGSALYEDMVRIVRNVRVVELE